MAKKTVRTIALWLAGGLACWPSAASIAQQDPKLQPCREIIDASGKAMTVCAPLPEAQVAPRPTAAPPRLPVPSEAAPDPNARSPATRARERAFAPPAAAPSTGTFTHGSIETSSARMLVPARALIEPSEMPPKGVGAYGIVAFTSLLLPQDMDRYKAVCEAFKATLIDQGSLGPETPLSSQMVTFWPLTQKTSPEAQHYECSYLVTNYHLKSGLDAIADADPLKQGLAEKRGPFLVAWSPARSRFEKDVVVLLVDFSQLESQESFLEVFKGYREKIVNDPNLWRSGFDIDSIRLRFRDMLDLYGQSLLKLIQVSSK
jgi:hypothetical protein